MHRRHNRTLAYLIDLFTQSPARYRQVLTAITTMAARLVPKAKQGHAAIEEQFRRRPLVAGLAALVVTVGFIGGAETLAQVATGSPDAAVAVADGTARTDAALRADRAARDGGAVVAPTAGAPVPVAPPVAAAPAPPADWVNPMPGVPLSSCFGMRWGVLHAGMDFAGDAGTPIRAAGAGRVFGAGWLYSGYGQSVVIDHGQGLFTHYAHASQILVNDGDWVAPGQIIALEGSTGDSTGPHLHFEVHVPLWSQIDPAVFLRDHSVQIGC